MKKKETKDRILTAALREFSLHGFRGARVDDIARRAEINKAMIFYYYTSKEELFRRVLRKSMDGILSEVIPKILLNPSIENLVDKLPEIHVRFFSGNPDFLRMVGLTLLQEPERIKEILTKEFTGKLPVSPRRLLHSIQKAYEKGRITEPDPLQFLINVISLNIFIFLGKPVIEALFETEIDQIENFNRKRVASIRHIIKEGMMK